MEIRSAGNQVTIKGNIKSIRDYQQIKETIDSMIDFNKHIVLTIEDSISITSSVIGYLNKLVLKDKVNLEIKVGDNQLMDLFEDLSLVSLFQVRKV